MHFVRGYRITETHHRHGLRIIALPAKPTVVPSRGKADVQVSGEWE